MLLLHVLYFLISIIIIRLNVPYHLLYDIVVNATLVWIARKFYIQGKSIYKQLVDKYKGQ